MKEEEKEGFQEIRKFFTESWRNIYHSMATCPLLTRTEDEFYLALAAWSSRPSPEHKIPGSNPARVQSSRPLYIALLFSKLNIHCHCV
jgi:hypothetical protein